MEKTDKNISNIALSIWLVLTVLLFVLLIYNHINALDIIKYRVDVYNAGDSVKFDLEEIKDAVESFKLLSIISISYVGLTGAFLYVIKRRLKNQQ